MVFRYFDISASPNENSEMLLVNEAALLRSISLDKGFV